MKVDRLKQAHARLNELLNGTSTKEAFQAVLNELGAAIQELESRPQTHINTEILTLSPQWKQWETNLGYAENPWVRTDMYVVMKMPGKKVYYAKCPGGTGGTFITDTKNRKKFWKHSLTAMACIDRDYPCSDKQTWAEKDAANAGSA